MPSKLMPRDEQFIRHIVDWGFLTPKQLQFLTAEPKIWNVQRRLLALSPNPRKVQGITLEGLGFLRSVEPPEERFGEMIWYPGQAAYDLALRRGWIEHPMRAVEWKRSNSKLVHDLLAVKYRFALLEAYGERFHASRYTYSVRYGWEDNEGKEKAWFADFLYYLDFAPRYPLIHLEWENTDEHSYARGMSERQGKVLAFSDFCLSGQLQERLHAPDGRMCLVIPTARQAENFIRKLHDMSDNRRKLGLSDDRADMIVSRKFWFTDQQSVWDVRGKVWMTPADYQTRRYSLDEA